MDARRWSNVCRGRRAYAAGGERVDAYPQEAYLEIATRCNLRCRMCPISYADRSTEPRFFPPQLFARLRPIFPTLLRAHLFGLGEPLLNPHLTGYLAELSAAGVETDFTTNATLIDAAKADELARAGVTRVAVSVDGATAATYEHIRRHARFDDLRRGLASLAAARDRHGRPQLSLSCVAMADNVDELPGLVELCARHGITELNLEPLYFWGSEIPELGEHYREQSLEAVPPERARAALAATARRAEQAGVRLISRLLVGSGSLDYRERSCKRPADPAWPCTEPWGTVSLTARGEVRTCCLNVVTFGSLAESSFDDIWNGDAYRAFRRSHAVGGTPPGCATCMANGRQRHSPWFAAVEPVAQRPLLAAAPPAPNGRGPEIDTPAAGATVTDPLVVTGRLPLLGPGRLGGGRPPALLIDHTAHPELAGAVTGGGRFVAFLRTPYLSEGAHVLSLGRSAGRPELGRSRRTVHFRREPGAEGIAVAATAAVCLRLERPVRRAAIRLGGRPWSAARWLCGRNGAGWVGAAVLDLGELAPGGYTLTVAPAGAPAVEHRLTRIADD